MLQGASALATRAGISLQDWQEDVLRDWSACDELGRFVHRRNYASIPRQAGKSTVAIAWVVSLVLAGYAVLWTCHNYSTTCEMRRRLTDIFGTRKADRSARHPEFNAYVSGANNKTGQEALFFSTGGILCFSTRTNSATLGYSFDVVIYDEAQELTDEQQQAILPTTTSGAKNNPQVIYTGTPLRPGRPGTVFSRARARIRAGEDGDADYSCWEWGVDEIGDVRDEARWATVNPSIGRVANLEAIRLALADMTDLAFAQEYLGYWLPAVSAEQPEISCGEWDALATQDPPREGKAVFAFKFAVDGTSVALAACRREGRGKPHVEVVEHRSLSDGAAWCADFAEQRAGTAAGFVIDGGGNAADLRDELRRRGLPKSAVVDPRSSDVAAACARFLNGIRARSFTHFAQPALDACACGVVKRQIGRSGFGFQGVDGIDPTMVEAAALALWGIDAIRRDPTRKGRAGC